MLNWDVTNGVARRAWSGNANANEAITRAQDQLKGLEITMPQHAETTLLDKLFA